MSPSETDHMRTEERTSAQITRRTVRGRAIRYELTILQEPVEARACGLGSTERQAVDPPPVLELRIFDETDSIGLRDITFLYNGNFFLYASLQDAPDVVGTATSVPQSSQPPVLTGMPVSGMAYLDKPRQAGYFDFPDLCVRFPGSFKLLFALYEETGDDEDMDAPTGDRVLPRRDGMFNLRMEVTSKAFTAYPEVWNTRATSSQELGIHTPFPGLSSTRIPADVESIASEVPSLTEGSTASSVMTTETIDNLRRDTFNMLLKHEEMRQLLNATRSRVDVEKFRRNFLRLFRALLSDLRAEMARQTQMDIAFRSLKRQSRNIISYASAQIYGREPGTGVWDELTKQVPNKEDQIRQYLAGSIGDSCGLPESFQLPSPGDVSDSDSGGSGIANPYRPVQLRLVESTILRSQAFSTFHKNYESFLFPSRSSDAAIHPQVVTDTSFTTHSITSQVLRALGGYPLKSLLEWVESLTRPHLKPGYRRLEWTCDWGDKLYADFVAADPDALQRLHQQLSLPRDVPTAIPSATVDAQEHPESAQAVNPVNRSRAMPAAPNRRPGAHSGYSAGRSFPPIPRQNNPTEHPRPKKFLELCVNTGEFEKSLAEIDVSDIPSDMELFRRIRAAYLAARGFRSKHFLLKPVDVHFVQFSLEDRRHVGIHDKPMALPDENQMLHHGYGYDPCPMVPMPPISANTFLHHLLKPEAHHPRRVWCGRMPKKLYSSILQGDAAIAAAGPDTLVVGWGVHIIEGLNKFNVLLAMLVILVGTTAVSVTWAWARNDVQGGFGIGAFLVGAQTLILMMVITKWGES